MVHKLVKKIAKGMAAAFHDNDDVFGDGRYDRTERFRKQYPKQEDFVAEQWPTFVPKARIALAHMLTEEGRSQGERDQIFDALLKDRGFMTDEDKVAPSIIRMD